MSAPIYLLDTNICIYASNGSGAAGERVSGLEPGQACVSTITLAELARGHALALPLSEPFLSEFCRTFPPLAFDVTAALRLATMPLRRNRFDRLIAAQALASGLIPVTADISGFADIPDLRVENWTRQ